MTSRLTGIRRFLFGKKQRPQTGHRRRNRRSRLESLENRQLLTAVVETGVDDQQISSLGEMSGFKANVEGNASAHNHLTGDTLVVWSATDQDWPGIALNEQEIYGRIVNEYGVVGDTFRISDAGGTGNDLAKAARPAVTWNANTNQYLVVWQADDTDSLGITDGEQEIFGQLIDHRGQEIGENDFRISDAGGSGDPTVDANTPSVAWNSVSNEYLVAWNSNDSDAGLQMTESDIFGQRLDSEGISIGVNDWRISNTSDLGGSLIGPSLRNRPDVVVNSATGDYLVTWRSRTLSEQNALGADVFGQLIDVEGNEIGTNDFQINSVSDTGVVATQPTAAYNTRDNEYFVTWSAIDPAAGLSSDQTEVFGQIFSALGTRTQTADLLISDAGGIGQDSVYTRSPSVTWNSQSNEYLVAWTANDTDQPNIGLSDNEVFAQRLDPTGQEVGANDFLISNAADPSHETINADRAVVVWNSRRNEYIISWTGNSQNSESDQIFAQRLQVQDSFPLDFSAAMNVDVVANRANNTNDPDQDTDVPAVLITDSFAQAAGAIGNGLADDGFYPASGVHPSAQLNYRNSDDGNNAVSLEPLVGSFEIPIENAYLNSFYLYGYSVSGNVDIRVTIVYTNGSTTRDRIVPAWTLGIPSDDRHHVVASDLSYLAGGEMQNQNLGQLIGLRFTADPSRTPERIIVRHIGATGDITFLGATGQGIIGKDLVVTTMDDEADGNVTPNDLSLREALHRAARNPRTQDKITFDSSLVDQTMSLQHGELDVFGQTLIEGPGADRMTIDAHGSSRIFDVFDYPGASSNITVSGLTLINGRFHVPGESQPGGAISNSASLFLDDVAIRDSSAAMGGAIYNDAFSRLFVFNSELSDNVAETSDGGAIYSLGSLHMENSTLGSNASIGVGGAIFVAKGDAKIKSSTLTSNRSNSINAFGLLDQINGLGGAITTGIDGTYSVTNSIVAGNFNGNGQREMADDLSGGLVTTSHHNLIGTQRGSASNLVGTNSNQVGSIANPIDPLFDPHATNGGTTHTFALRPGSPAIDAGDNSAIVFDQDQRGGRFTRIAGGTVDIGAYERQDLTVSIADATAKESDDGIEFELTLSDVVPLGEQITIILNTTDQSASADSDYAETVNRMLTIDGGDALTHTIKIDVIDDDLPEAPETFGVTVSAGIGLPFDDVTATGTIEDDDEAWHNTDLPADVNRDGSVTALDALIIINDLNRSGTRTLELGVDPYEPFIDVNDDGSVTALDALHVINHMNRQQTASAELVPFLQNNSDEDTRWAKSVDSVLSLF